MLQRERDKQMGGGRQNEDALNHVTGSGENAKWPTRL
uniref:Uncharacterized protein n=1 Tax=Anguilla anguilla TaxID=7936 RepID=A0A0E9PCZ7_ANGAN